jgi:hypothetical protein
LEDEESLLRWQRKWKIIKGDEKMKKIEIGNMSLSFKLSGQKIEYIIRQFDERVLRRFVEQNSINLIEMFELFAFLVDKDQKLRQRIDNADILSDIAMNFEEQDKLTTWGMQFGTEESS